MMRIIGVAVALVSACASFDEPVPDPAPEPTSTSSTGVEHRDVCHGPGAHCMAKVVTEHGRIRSTLLPIAYGPPDIQSAYHVDPTLGTGMTIGIVDAFGYPSLESDLAAYRQHFGLPQCSIASGCLTLVNDGGMTSPLPGLSPPGGEDWTIETALDVDMVSAACPLCKILVVQTNTSGPGLFIGTLIAGRLGATTISNSWGSQEFPGETGVEGNFDVPGVAVFASSGDFGFAAGPQYPSSSAVVIAVGGTHMITSVTDPRGWSEAAWDGAGSSCSAVIPKPGYQRSTGCAMRAVSDVSAVADPNTGVAVFNAANGGWISLGGTSAASPLLAAITAAAGHGDATPAFFWKHPEVLNDVTAGNNGTCTGPMCNAGVGWDGPTGLGTPDQAKMLAVPIGPGPSVTITFPADGATVAGGFTVAATVGPGTAHVDLVIDGTKVSAMDQPPFNFSAPNMIADGSHAVQVLAYDESHDSSMAAITVQVGPPPGPPPDMNGCSAGSGSSLWLALACLGLLRLTSARRR